MSSRANRATSPARSGHVMLCLVRRAWLEAQHKPVNFVSSHAQCQTILIVLRAGLFAKYRSETPLCLFYLTKV
jgi:hypothetical protein